MPTKQQLKEANKALSEVDWKKLEKMSDEDIEAAAKADPENPPATEDELARAWIVKPLPPKAAAE